MHLKAQILEDIESRLPDRILAEFREYDAKTAGTAKYVHAEMKGNAFFHWISSLRFDNIPAPARSDVLKAMDKEDAVDPAIKTLSDAHKSRSTMALFVSEALDIELAM